MFIKSRETDRLNSRVRVSLLHGKLELKPSYQKTETERVKSGRPESGKARVGKGLETKIRCEKVKSY